MSGRPLLVRKIIQHIIIVMIAPTSSGTTTSKITNQRLWESSCELVDDIADVDSPSFELLSAVALISVSDDVLAIGGVLVREVSVLLEDDELESDNSVVGVAVDEVEELELPSEDEVTWLELEEMAVLSVEEDSESDGEELLEVVVVELTVLAAVVETEVLSSEVCVVEFEILSSEVWEVEFVSSDVSVDKVDVLSSEL